MKGIRGRLLVSYIVSITITVIVLESILLFALRQYYYNSVKSLLSNQIIVSADFYNTYFSSSALRKNVQDNADIFWKNTTAEVQIIDKDGNILMDSIGDMSQKIVQDEDVKAALTGNLGSFIKKENDSKVKEMYVAYPLRSGGKVEGAIRFIASLEDVDNVINKLKLVETFIGIIVVLIAGSISIFISNSIVSPLKELNLVARTYAAGRFNDRIKTYRKDEVGELSDTLNFMAEEIQKNEKLKNEFIASVSHELLTPLTSIKGWASTLRTSEAENLEDTLTGLEIIEKESDRLTSLVKELLDFSSFVTGKATLKKDYLDISMVLEYLGKQFAPRAERQGLSFKVQIEGDIKPILGDEDRINQVIINLLDNAFKFTPEGGEVILKSFVDGSNLVLSVIDNGEGIPKEELPKVTEKFFKGKSTLSTNGIGLSVCKEIIELHNGRLCISSVLNEGTRVDIYLPYSDNQ